MKKPTVSILLDTRRVKKENRYPVKLRVTYERKQRYYFFSLDLTEDEFKEVMLERPKKALQKAKDEIKAAERKAWNIIDDLKEFSFKAFELRIGRTEPESKNVYYFFEQYIDALKLEKRVGTAASYQCSLNSLKAFQPRLEFKEIDERFLHSYEKWMLDEGNSITTVGIYLRCLRTMFNKAISEGIVLKEVYPFQKHKYVIPAARNVKKALTLEEVKLLFQEETVPGTAEDFAKDIWLFSYMSNGMNIKDISMLRVRDVDGEYLRFVRAKTARSTRNAQTLISVYLTDKSQHIITKWRRPNASAEDYLFPILQPGLSPEKEMRVIQQAVKQVNKYIKRIAVRAGINKEVTSYFARHSFATVLKKSGASVEYISESLGHQNLSTTRAYLDSFEDDTKKKMASLLINF